MTDNKEGMMASQRRTRSQTKKNVLTTVVRDTLEDVKPSILKYVDPAMLKDPFEAVAVKQEVDDDCIKVEHELDPLSVTDIKPQDVIMQLVSEIQIQKGIHIKPENNMDCSDSELCNPESLNNGLMGKASEHNGTARKVDLGLCSLNVERKELDEQHNAVDSTITRSKRTTADCEIEHGPNYPYMTPERPESHELEIDSSNNNECSNAEFMAESRDLDFIDESKDGDVIDECRGDAGLIDECGDADMIDEYRGDAGLIDECRDGEFLDTCSDTDFMQESTKASFVKESTDADFIMDKNIGEIKKLVILLDKINVEPIQNHLSSVGNTYFMNSNVAARRRYFSCKLCKKRFTSNRYFKMHVESKCGLLKLFNCHICNKAYATRKYLKFHLKISHSGGSEEGGDGSSKVHKCEHCHGSYKYRYSLVKHIKYKHKTESTQVVPHICQYCQKSYKRKRGLREHINSKHENTEHYKCAHCSKMFFRKCKIVDHMKRFHLPDQIRCLVCKYFFASQENLEKHICKLNVHRDTKDKNLICDQCGKKCKDKNLLLNHLRIHTGEKPFMCQDCGKCFRTRTNLVQHSVVHSERRPFACSQCSSTFRIKNHLRQHMAVHGLVNTSVKRRNTGKKKSNFTKKE